MERFIKIDNCIIFHELFNRRFLKGYMDTFINNAKEIRKNVNDTEWLQVITYWYYDLMRIDHYKAWDEMRKIKYDITDKQAIKLFEVFLLKY